MPTPQTSDSRVADVDVAPSIGLVLAAVALIASVLRWTGETPGVVRFGLQVESAVGLGLAVALAAVFLGRKWGVLGHRVGAPLAGLLGIALFCYGVVELMRPALGTDAVPAVGLGLPLAALAGLAAAATALGDWFGLSDLAFKRRLEGLITGFAIGFGAFAGTLVGQVFSLPLLPLEAPWEYAVVTVLGYAGTVGFVVVYFRIRDLSSGYLDIGWPSLRGVVAVVAGLVILIVSLVALSQLFEYLGVPSAPSQVQERANENPAIALYMIPLSLLVIAPVEELAYRNVVQKYLYESFSGRSAVVVGAVVFAGVHFLQYANPNPLATLSTLSVIFVLSLLLGYVYYRTENLVVPILVHGIFNALQFVSVYVNATGGTPAG